MLEEKLEQARSRRTGRNRKIFIVLTVAGILLSLLLITLSSLDFSKDQEDAPVKDQRIPPQVVDSEENRQAFKKALFHYESEYETRLQSNGIEKWDEIRFFELREMKENALLHFSNGEYQQAVDQIKVLEERAAHILLEAERSFNDNFEKAVRFFKNDQYDEAHLHINQALVTAPQSPDAITLQREIEQLPTLLPLLHGAAVARSEKNLQKEYDFLQQIAQIAPERTEQNQRLEIVAERIIQQQFEKQIGAGFAEIDNGKAQKARAYYLKAKGILPERNELSLLMTEIVSLEKSMRIQRALIQAEEAVRKDDWQKAKMYFARVIDEDPNNTNALDGIARADRILQLQERFRQFFASPYRLTDKNVQKSAKKTLLMAQKESQFSFSIKRQASQLEELTAKLSRKIPVRITSDTKTNVLVRGVGKVGTIAHKEILLLPGNYTFEGTRDGYKSKLLHVLIPYDKDVFTLHISCDEPI